MFEKPVAPGDGVGISDKIDVTVTMKNDKPYQSPEHCIALTVRRNALPQKWYPISLKLDWRQHLICECWLKIVSHSGVCTIGKIYTHPGIANSELELYGQSMLIDGNFDKTWSLKVYVNESHSDPIVQVFVSNEEVANDAANILRAQINGQKEENNNSTN